MVEELLLHGSLEPDILHYDHPNIVHSYLRQWSCISLIFQEVGLPVEGAKHIVYNRKVYCVILI